MQVNVDLLLFLRCLGAVLWGVLLALWLQRSRIGRYLEENQMWFVVSLGAGIVLLLGLAANWLTITILFFCSSWGIVVRAFWNQTRCGHFDLGLYRTKWHLEDAIDVLGGVIGKLQKTLEEVNSEKKMALVSQALSQTHQAQHLITLARYGEPEKEKGRRDVAASTAAKTKGNVTIPTTGKDKERNA